MAMEDLHRRRIDEREILGLIQEKKRNVSPNVVNKKRDKVFKKRGGKARKKAVTEKEAEEENICNTCRTGKYEQD